MVRVSRPTARDWQLTPATVQIWQLHLPSVTAQVPEWSRWLSIDEQQRMERFVFETDRVRYGLSRGGLRYLLGEYLQQSPETLVFDQTANGKPFLAVAGELPLHFNLSHSGDWVVYAISSQMVGVDIEQVRPLRHLSRLAERCLSAAEQADLAQWQGSGGDRRFLDYWTCKEAYLKATGEGLTYPLDQVTVTLASPPTIRCLTSDRPSSQDWTLHTWEPVQGYVAALVVAGAADAIHYRHLHETVAPSAE